MILYFRAHILVKQERRRHWDVKVVGRMGFAVTHMYDPLRAASLTSVLALSKSSFLQKIC